MKIAINGCGVAGPTLAYWLKKYGYEPVIYEIAPTLREGGYVIDFWGLGYRIAEKMGLSDTLHEKGYLFQNLIIMDEHGKSVAQNDIGIMTQALDGRYVSIKRSDLARAIYEHLDGVTTHFGVSIVGLNEDETGVDITLSDGSKDRVDLVVGADGLHSELRKMTFGAMPDAEADLGVYVSAFTAKGYPHRDELSYVMYPQVGRQIARTSLRDDETLIFFAFKKSLVENDVTTRENQMSVVRQVFENTGWESKTILEFLDQSEDFYFDEVKQIQLSKWSKGRVALIGDAAACASLLAGEGSGLGMLEAYVLAGELHKSGGDHRAAFAAYERELQPLLRKKQKAARRFQGFVVPPSSFSMMMSRMGVRAASYPLVSKPFFGRMLKDDYTLKDYEN